MKELDTKQIVAMTIGTVLGGVILTVVLGMLKKSPMGVKLGLTNEPATNNFEVDE